jgi:large subunit ribosomal protein L9
MEVLLLEKINRLGNLGEIVRVRNGHARNYLVPQGKALIATRENRARFEAERSAFEAKQQEVLAQAEALAVRIREIQVTLQRPAGVMDKLFGSVTNSDIADFLTKSGVELPRNTIEINRPIRTLGEHGIRIRLHPDVVVEMPIRVERVVK